MAQGAQAVHGAGSGHPASPLPLQTPQPLRRKSGTPQTTAPPSLLFPPPPASCPEQGTLPPPWPPRHPQAPTPPAATRRANGSTETRGRPSAKRKPPRAAAGGAPQPSPRAGLQHRDTLPAPQGPPTIPPAPCGAMRGCAVRTRLRAACGSQCNALVLWLLHPRRVFFGSGSITRWLCRSPRRSQDVSQGIVLLPDSSIPRPRAGQCLCAGLSSGTTTLVTICRARVSVQAWPRVLPAVPSGPGLKLRGFCSCFRTGAKLEPRSGPS